MKKLVRLIIVLFAAVAFVIVANRYPGYVLIDVNGLTIEANLILVIILLVVLFIASHYALRLFSGISAVPQGLRFWQNRRQAEKADQNLMLGLIKLAECKWSEAEQLLSRFSQNARTPLLNYLAAARAAHELGAYDRRDQYMKLAHQSMPEAQIAVGLTQAELLLAQDQKEQALATLRHLQSVDPKNVKVLRTLGRLYQQVGDWENLIAQCGLLRKYKAVAEEKIQRLEKMAYLSVMKAALQRQEPVQNTWYRLPKNLQQDEEVLTLYVEYLSEQNSDDIAEPLIRNYLKKKWNQNLILLYGTIQGADPQQQLSFAESLLEQQEKDAVLLLTLGRLCLRSSLWGKARNYLEAGIGASPSAEAYAELGRLLERLGEHDQAVEYYRRGLLAVPSCRRVISDTPRLEQDGKTTPLLLGSSAS